MSQPAKPSGNKTYRLAEVSLVLSAVAAVCFLSGVSPAIISEINVNAMIVCDFLCVVTGIPAIIIGVLALIRIRKSKGVVAGKRVAVSGIGVSGILMLLVFVIMPSPAELSHHGRPSCQTNLSYIDRAANMWLLKSGDNKYYPSSLKVLVDDLKLKPEVLLCPAQHTDPVPGQFTTDYECILDLVGRQVTEAETPYSLPLAWDKKGNHKDGRNVVFFDSHCEFLLGDDFEQRLLPQINQWVQAMKAAKPPDGDK